MLGIDIGGANLKIVGEKSSRSIYTPLWKERGWSRLKSELDKTGEVAAVITGELADRFKSRKEGIKEILKLIEKTGNQNLVYGYKGFYPISKAYRNPLDFAAANWVASAEFLNKKIGNSVLVDIGSTTCDIIPVTRWSSTSDLERLKKRELVYSGALRTDVSSLTKQVKVKNSFIPLAKEKFAVTGDIYRVLGFIDEQKYSTPPVDGRTSSKKDCMRRIAKIVCTDLEELSKKEIKDIARQIKNKQTEEIKKAVKKQAKIEKTEKIAICGTGSFLVKNSLKQTNLEIIDLKEIYGDKSEMFPAFAVYKLSKNL